MPHTSSNSAAAAMRQLNQQMAAFQGFPLAESATQIVPGSGAVPASIMLLGEQPGEQEDLAGQVFIGPAGKLLDKALTEAGIARSDVYITNTLKHYKFKLQDKKRVHMVPGRKDIKTYMPWLEREIAIVQPAVIVTLGGVAAQTLAGKELSLEASRGQILKLENGLRIVPTYHPSFVLRTPDEAMKELRYQRLVADLALAANTADT